MANRFRIKFILSVLIPLFAVYGCNKTPIKPEQASPSPKQLEELSTVPKVSGADKLKNGHTAMLYLSQKGLNSALIGGIPAAQFPAVKTIAEQKNRQFQNALAERQAGKILGGTPAANAQFAREFASQVALVYTSFPDVPDGFFCGGTLISSTRVLTAAHCLVTLQPQDLEVYVGSYSLASGGRLIGIAPSGILIHEGYNGSDTYPLNDIALLKLAEPVTDIPPIVLLTADNSSKMYSTNNALISGWGQTVQGSGNGSIDLLYARVAIVPFNTCNSGESYNGVLKQGMICATRPKTDTCQGDSGGPLTVFGQDGNLYEEGIVSWGIGCAQAQFPGVYVSTVYYADWLKSHIQ